jgi:hypothetical protein
MMSMFGAQEVETGAGLGRGGIHELGGIRGGEVGDEQQGWEHLEGGLIGDPVKLET